jgi:hypothetical protein
MSNERLLARLRDPNEMTCADGIEAANCIEALEQQVADLLANVPCACGYDSPTDVCMKHLPLVRNLTARAEKAEAALKEAEELLSRVQSLLTNGKVTNNSGIQVFRHGTDYCAVDLLAKRIKELEAERDAYRDQMRDPLLSNFAAALRDHKESIPAEIWAHIDALQKQIDYSANGKYGPVYSGPMVDDLARRAEAAEVKLKEAEAALDPEALARWREEAVQAEREAIAAMIEASIEEAKMTLTPAQTLLMPKVEQDVLAMLAAIVAAIRARKVGAA